MGEYNKRITWNIRRDMKMREKFTELRDFMSDYYTIPIGAYTDVLASEFLKMPGSK